MKIKNIIFDLSGVLIDDVFVVYSSYMHVFRLHKVKEITLEQFKDEFVLPYYHFMNKYLPDTDVAQLKKEYYEHYNKQNHKLKTFKETKETLEFLNANKINAIVLSAKNQLFVEKDLEENNLKQFFTAIYGSVKNKSEVINEILKKHNFNPEETAYVGDMQHDIDAGKKGNVKTIAILTGYQSKSMLEKSNPDFIINNLEELKILIQSAS